jgi:hypothetical protein
MRRESMFRYLPFALLVFLFFSAITRAEEFEVCVKYLEKKGQLKNVVFLQSVPADAMVLGSVTIFAEPGKRSKATAQVDKRTFELSVLIEKVEKDEITMQVTAGSALDLNPGRDYWQSHVTHKIHLGKSWGMWKSSSNEVTNGLFLSVTGKSQKGGPDDKTDQQPEKDVRH